ncbi:unnamed protein product [Symbiodinium natans]|uniref:Uncharacterized protein n=1 Tax=Symbiodinium natans TaxID=878477 RepID=A0A812UYE1_9DINO|nr:unnamed protein product [Symbiodinium natans]
MHEHRTKSFVFFLALGLGLWKCVVWDSTFKLRYGWFPNEPSPVCKRRLVLHVGMHKTGTSFLQKWMHTHNKWLAKHFGVLAMPRAAHCTAMMFNLNLTDPVDDVPIDSLPEHVKFRCRRFTLNRTFDFLVTALENPSAPVIISTEAFSTLLPGRWEHFLSYLHNKTRNLPCFAVSPVVFLRSPSSWSQSQWIQRGKKSSNPLPRADWLAGSWSEEELRHYMTLLDTFGKSVLHVVSYDMLLEANQSLQAFLICNATLGMDGASWSGCQEMVDSKGIGTKRANISPSPAALDIVTLARHMYNIYTMGKNGSSCKFGLTSLSSEVGAVAANMPQGCNDWHERFAQLEDRLYNLSGLVRPQSRTQWCGVNETQLQPHHWKLIEGLLPECVKTL